MVDGWLINDVTLCFYIIYQFLVFMLLDFGVDHLVSIAKSTKFPWLMSNVVDKMTSQPLAEGLVKRIITWEGRKVRYMQI